MIACWRAPEAIATVAIPPGGLDVYVYDLVESRRIESPGRLEPGESGYEYRVRYVDSKTDVKWSRLANLSQMDQAVYFMRQMKVGIPLADGSVAAGLPFRIVVDFTSDPVEIGLAVQYFHNGVGEEVVSIDLCQELGNDNFPPDVRSDMPDWKSIHVYFKGTNRRGRRNRPLHSMGRVFLNEGRRATELIPKVNVVYPGTNQAGSDQNLVARVGRHEVMDAFTLFNFGNQPLLVEHPTTLNLVAVKPLEVILDMRRNPSRVLVSVRTIGANPQDLEIEPQAFKGLANVFCASLLAR